MRFPLHRSAAVSIALAAMLLRALLPDGWMPSAGAAPFTLCSITAPSHHGKAPANPDRTHAPCAFAAAAPLAPPVLALHVFHAPSEAIAPVIFRKRLASFSAAYRPNAARAPPAFA
jgi:hypothetical protein